VSFKYLVYLLNLLFLQYLKQHQDLSQLPCADGAAFNSRLWQHEPECLPDTRVDLLQQIIAWSDDCSGASIFWLNGIAGTGKSTIARTVARKWYKQNRLGASFFFSKGRGDLGHATKLFTTIAAHLTIALPAVVPYICKAMRENPDILQRGLADQWKYLIVQPLANLQEVSSYPHGYILVIDAVDECEGDADTRLMIRLLAEAKTLKAVPLRVFLTSRPETPIRLGFSHDIPEETHRDYVLHNISLSIIEHDISVFLRHKMQIIRRETSLSEGWPGDDTIELLCQKSHGLFIYAATACRFICDPLWNPAESLSLILKDAYVGQSATHELDQIYTRILEHSIIYGDLQKRNQEKLSSEFRLIAGSIIILFDALSVSMLARLLELPVETINVRLRFLHSVLGVPISLECPVRLLHPSFRDYLLDQQQCQQSRLSIDEKVAHDNLFVRCIKLMSKHLARDICKLRLPGALNSDVEDYVVMNCLPLDVQYACCYWVNHLQRSKIELCDNDRVHTFLRKHFLHWLEALSLIGKISDSILMLKTLESILIVSCSISCSSLRS